MSLWCLDSGSCALSPLRLIFPGLWPGSPERIPSGKGSVSEVGICLWDLLSSEMLLPNVAGSSWGTGDDNAN